MITLLMLGVGCRSSTLTPEGRASYSQELIERSPGRGGGDPAPVLWTTCQA